MSTVKVAKLSCPPDLLLQSVEGLYVMEAVGSTEEILALEKVELQVHAYKLQAEATSTAAHLSTDGAFDVDEQSAARILELPADQLDGTWD